MSKFPVLLIDVGNTRLKWGLDSNGRIAKTGRVSLEKLHDTSYAALTTRIPTQVSQVLVSNVAGSVMAKKLSSVIGLHCNAPVQLAHCKRRAYGVTLSYRQPRRMGVDRWVAMIGAHHEFRSALCVVDAGTATTLDALDKTGLHLGGQIIPGVHMMGEALHANASDIGTAGRGRKGPTDTLGLFGKSTSEAVAFGALAAAAGAVELAVKRMRSAGFRPKLVLTGGDASRILEQLHSSALHRPNLVLQGLSVMSNGES